MELDLIKGVKPNHHEKLLGRCVVCGGYISESRGLSVVHKCGNCGCEDYCNCEDCKSVASIVRSSMWELYGLENMGSRYSTHLISVSKRVLEIREWPRKCQWTQEQRDEHTAAYERDMFEFSERMRPVSREKSEEIVASPPPLLGGLKSKSIEVDDDLNGSRTARECLRVDWLQGSFEYRNFSTLYAYLGKMTNCEPEEGRGFIGFERSQAWEEFGIKLVYDIEAKYKAQHGNRFLLQIQGQGLSLFPAQSLFIFIKYISGLGFKSTRLDLAFDDYFKTISPYDVYQKLRENPEILCGFRGYVFYDGRRVRMAEFGKDIVVNQGVGFGTRGKNGSGRYFRFYDKEKESKGKIPAYRWEVEFSKERSNEAFGLLADADDLSEFSTVLGSLIGGAIDFIEPDRKTLLRDEKNRLPFWEKMVRKLGTCKTRAPTKSPSIDKTRKWLIEVVLPSMLKMELADGQAGFWGLIRDSLDMSKPSDRAKAQLIAYWEVNGMPDLEETVSFLPVPF